MLCSSGQFFSTLTSSMNLSAVIPSHCTGVPSESISVMPSLSQPTLLAICSTLVADRLCHSVASEVANVGLLRLARKADIAATNSAATPLSVMSADAP